MIYWKVKFIGGPRAGKTEAQSWVDRRLEVVDMRTGERGVYVLVEKDSETMSAAMRWEGR